jgi:ABC-type transporter Mla subunit MlaD
MASTVSGILSAVFGLNAKISTSAASIGNGAEEASSGYEQLGNSAEEAGKKANGATAPFDKLNQMADSASTIDGGTIDAPVIDVDAAESTVDNGTAITESFEDLREAIEPTLESLEDFKEALEPVAEFVFDNLESFYKDVLKPIGKWILGEGLPDLLDAGSDLIEEIDWDRLAGSIKNFNKAIAPFAISVGKGFILFVKSLVDMLTPGVSGSVNLLSDGLNLLAEAIGLVPEDAAIAIGGAIGGLVTAVLLFNGASSAVGIISKLGPAISTMISTIGGSPVLVLGAALAAVAGGIMALNQAKFENSDVGALVDELDNLADAAKDTNKELQDILEQQDERTQGVETEYGAVQILADKYFDLADKASLTNDEQLLMKTYAQELIKKIPELNGLIDDQTGAYEGTKEEIQSLITKTKEYYLVQAAQESLTKLANGLFEAEQALTTAVDKKAEAQAKLNEIEKEYEGAMAAVNGTSEQYDEWNRTHTKSAADLYKEIKELKKSMENYDTEINTTKGLQKDLNKQFDYATDYITTYSGAVVKEMPKVKGAIGSALDDISKAVSEFKMPKLMIEIGVNTPDSLGNLKGIYDYPGYATGNVIPANFGNFMAVLGDNKKEPEVVSPLSTIEKAVENVLNRRGGSGEGQYTFIAQIDGKTIFKETIKQDQFHKNATGKSAFGY